MDINEFREKMRTAKPLTHFEQTEHIQTLVNNSDEEIDFAIAVEEMSELTQLLTKHIREVKIPFERDRVLEETADVFICMHLIQARYGFTDEELAKAYAVKLTRDVERI